MTDQQQETSSAPTEAAAEPQSLPFAEFLEGVPPSQGRKIIDLWEEETRHGNKYRTLKTPRLQLHCTTETCNGLRIFRYSNGNKSFPTTGESKELSTFITYVCSNCRRTAKRYSLYLVPSDGGSGSAYKDGELPPYGPPTPARLIRLFGKDRDIFLKGRQCENHALGIGAFVYYRRVVESHKNQILDEIIRVSEKIESPGEVLAVLQAAKEEHQFSKAIEMVKDAIPQALLVNGHNPMTLLHSALSVGLHEQTDEKCLELAHDVRIVLIELAERLSQALKDEAELNTAISRLMTVKRDKE
jgi:hypothetical protein